MKVDANMQSLLSFETVLFSMAFTSPHIYFSVVL